MATGGHFLADDQAKRRRIETNDLTDRQIELLAREMEARKLESIAIADLGIRIETVNNLKTKHRGDFIASNRDLLVEWRSKNPGTNQVQVRIFHNFERF